MHLDVFVVRGKSVHEHLEATHTLVQISELVAFTVRMTELRNAAVNARLTRNFSIALGLASNRARTLCFRRWHSAQL